jgi:hypothetical protein
MKTLMLWRLAYAASTAASWVLTPLSLLVMKLAQLAHRSQAHAELEALYALARLKTTRKLRAQR